MPFKKGHNSSLSTSRVQGLAVCPQPQSETNTLNAKLYKSERLTSQPSALQIPQLPIIEAYTYLDPNQGSLWNPDIVWTLDLIYSWVDFFADDMVPHIE